MRTEPAAAMRWLGGLCVCLALAQGGGWSQDARGPADLLARYARANASERDAFVANHRSRLVELFHDFLRIAASEAAGRSEGPPGTNAAHLVKDLGARAQRLFGVSTFAHDANNILGLEPEPLLLRTRLVQRLRELHRGSRSNPGSEAARERLSTLLAHLEEFANEHEDRDLLRFSALVDVESLRQTQPEDVATRVRALEKFATLLAAHDLRQDERFLLAEVELASIYLRGGEVALAEAALKSARGATANVPVPKSTMAQLLCLECETLTRRGFAHAVQDKVASLVRLLPEMAAEARDTADSRYADHVSGFYFQAAAFRAQVGAHEEARHLYEAALAEPGLRPGQQMRLRAALAEEHLILGNLERARTLARDVRQQLEGLKPPEPEFPLQAQLTLQQEIIIAEASTRMGEADQARVALRAARARELRVGEKFPRELRARLHLAEGFLAALEGDFDRALSKNDDALLAVPRHHPSTETVQALWAKSRLLIQSGEGRPALETAVSALEVARRVTHEHDFLVFGSEVGIAQIHLSTNDPPEALRTLDRALSSERAFLKSRPVPKGRALRLRAEARWRLADGRPKEAELHEIYRDARGAIQTLADAGKRGGPTPLLASETLKAHELIQEIRVATGDDPLGKASVEEAEHFWQSCPGERASEDAVSWKEARCSLNLLRARSLELQGSREGAITAYKEAASLESLLRRGLRFRAPDGLSARFETIHERIVGLLFESATELNDPALIREALLFLEETRAQSLRTLISASESRLRDELSDQSETGAIRRVLSAPPELDTESLQGLLRPDRAVLVYAVLPRASYVIALRGERLSVHRLPVTRVVLEREVHGLLQNLQGEPDRFKAQTILELGQVLYRRLVGPVAHLTEGAREIVVVPDGVLHGLPFEVLIEGPCLSGAPLERHDFRDVSFLARRLGLASVTYTQSLATLSLLGRRSQLKASPRVLLIGNPTLTGADLPAIPHAGRELREIGELFPRDAVTLLEGPRATARDFRDVHAEGFGIVHIATHSERARHRDGPAAMILSGDEGRADRFGAADVAGLSLQQTRLVVLSSCDSGLGYVAGSEGLISLPRAFLIAGAQWVVAAGLPVHDAKTPELMRGFYRRVVKGQTPGIAMAAARAELLQTARLSWPGFWGPFFVLGVP